MAIERRLKLITGNIYQYDIEPYETLPTASPLLLSAGYFAELPNGAIVKLIDGSLGNVSLLPFNNFTLIIDETGTASVTGSQSRILKNNKLVAVGDSRIGLSQYPTNGTDNWRALDSRNAISWLFALTNAPLSHIHYALDNTQPAEGDSVGWSGQRADTIYLRYKRDVLDKDPGLVFMLMGTNDCDFGGRTAEHIASTIIKMVEDANAIGAHVWLCTIDPQSDFDGTEEAKRLALNGFLRAYAATNPNMELIDVDAILATGTGVGGFDQQWYTDDVHFNSRGAHRVATLGLLPAYQRINPAAFTKYYMPDLYTADTTVSGNIHPNPLLSGTGGWTNSSQNGDIPDLIRVATSSTTGFTIADSTVQREDLSGVTRNFVKIDGTCTGAGSDNASVRFSTRDVAQTADQDAIITGYVVNSWYQAQIEVHLDASTRGLIRNLTWWVQDFLGVTTTTGNRVQDYRSFGDRYTDDEAPFAKDTFPNEPLKVVLTTPPIRAAGDRFLAQMRLQLDGTVAGNFAIYVSNPIIRRLPYMPAINHRQRLFMENIATGEPRALMLNDQNIVATQPTNQYTAPVASQGLPTYTVATLPAASGHTNRIVYVSNGRAGQPCVAVSNGTNWLRTDTYATVSAS